jgi:hypothetical protein
LWPYEFSYSAIYPRAIENAKAVATACNTALDVAALALEFDEIESLNVIDAPLPLIVIVLVVVFAVIVILLPGTILKVSVGEPARINELFALIVANDCELEMKEIEPDGVA